jgi:signal transduction histidine kinase
MRAVLLLAALVSVAPQPQAATVGEHQRQVLAIYSTRRDAQVAVVGEQYLPRLLEEGLGGRIDYYSEFIDPQRFPDQAYQEALGDFLRLKYKDHQFDLIVAIGDDATGFAGGRRDVFAGAPPVVFYGTSREMKRPGNATGVVAQVNLRDSVELARSLDPELRHVYVVSGADRSDTAFADLARQQLRGLGSSLDVIYLGGLPTATLETRLRELPGHSAVYYLTVSQDGAGARFHPLQYLDTVVAAAAAPVYSWVDSTIGRGIVGGSLKSQSAQIAAVADVCLRVLRGEPADAIPVVHKDLNIVEIDWRELRRWGLPESRVPAAASVLYREPTAWERYRLYILSALVVLLAQTLLIAGLLVQSNRRRRAESRVLQREAQLHASYARIRDLGARLLHAQDRERAHIARELHDDVSQQLALIEMDVTLLGGNGDASSDLLARVQSLGRSIRDLSHRLHPAKLRLIGIVAALKGLQTEVSHSGVEIDFTHEGVPPALPADVTVCLFRVAQEALQNAVKYSRGRRITVHLAGTADCVVLTVQDDGVGFDVDSAYGTGLGLLSMKERVEAIAGRIDVRSGSGAGTRVQVTVPVAPRKAGVVAV